MPANSPTTTARMMVRLRLGLRHMFRHAILISNAIGVSFNAIRFVQPVIY